MTSSCSSPFDRASELSVACFQSNVGEVKKILAQLADEPLKKDRTCCFSLTPLHFAVWGGCFEAFQMLLYRGLKLEKGSSMRVRRTSSVSLLDVCDGVWNTHDLRFAVSDDELKRVEDRKRIREVLERGSIRKNWDWQIRRLLLIRDGAFAQLPKDICRLLVRSYCFDLIPVYHEKKVK
jgi:hypothetical protein